MKKSTKKILTVSGIAAVTAAAAAAGAYAATKTFVDLAMNRESTALSKKLGGDLSGENTGAASAAKSGAEKLAAKENTVITVTAYDGVSLTGHWIPAENPKRAVIAMHGWRSSWCDDFGVISDFLEASGCSVLYAEQRGQHNSGGDYMGFGLLERYDCLTWIDWVTENCGSELPVYICGISMGATTVLMASGLYLPDNVKGIVADSGFTSADAIWKSVAEGYLHIPYGITGGIANRICRSRIDISADAFSTVDALKTCTKPVLFIHGADDHFVPVNMTYENYLACPSEKELFVVPGAGHCMSYLVDPESYEARLQRFWEKHDSDV